MPTAAERFWSKVTTEGECLVWTAHRDRLGYGKFHPTSQGSVLAHRYSFYLAHGRWPNSDLDHLCRNPSCVNPSHLEEVTARENTLRGNAPAAINARKTHCKHGHALVGDNIIWRGHRRNCRACYDANAEWRRNYARDWEARNKERRAKYRKAKTFGMIAPRTPELPTQKGR